MDATPDNRQQPDNVIRSHQAELEAIMADTADVRVRMVGLLRLSEAMVQSAQAGDWDQVDAMEQRRRLELEACFGAGPNIDGTPLMVEAVATLLQLNERLVELVAAAREAAAAASRRAATGQLALAAYRGVQPGGR